jgi:predicted TIM-barrel fold metal-dependent hydrolase
MLEEYWYWVRSENPIYNHPGYALPNGAWRAVYPGAELASLKYPDRFSFFVRIDRRDPELESVMRVIAGSPHARAFRFLATRTPEEAKVFVEGGFDQAFAIAQDTRMPVCLAIPGFVEYLPRYLKKFPDVQFVLDHWGLAAEFNTIGLPESEKQRMLHPDYLDRVMALGEHPNVSIKISHAQMYFDAPTYPFASARPPLHCAIKAFGADRVLFSSDVTVMRPPAPWADLVHFIRNDPDILEDDKAKILGANSRRIFDWPAGS